VLYRSAFELVVMSRRGPTRRKLLVAVGASAASGLAGCIDEEFGTDEPLIGDPEAHVEVELSADADGVSVDPPIAHVVNGGTVEWFADDGEHPIAAYHPNTHGDQQRVPDDVEPWCGEVSSSAPFDRVFDGEAVHDYACTTHEDEGMVGTVLVGLPDPDEQPGLEPPSDEYPDVARERLEEYNERVRDVLTEAYE
jgi:plastocyanin